jgi:multimeric flavodoxin WrbA
MTKNILIFESSPRKKGNTAVLAAQAAAGLREGGVEVETIRLHGLSIAPCNACDGCVRKKVNCVLQDDMQSIYPKLAAADGVILASPIYWFNINAQLKTCIDRWYGLWQNNHDVFKGKPVGVIFVYGDSDLYTSGGINAIHTFETMFRFLGIEPAGFVYGTTNNVGDAEKNPELMESARQLGVRMAERVS